jgi:hypothetical protein
MPIEEILILIRARPFIPFRIHLLDGRTFDVLHPELVMPGARSILVGWSADPALPFFDPGRHEIVSLLAVSRLEPLPTLQPSGDGQNG